MQVISAVVKWFWHSVGCGFVSLSSFKPFDSNKLCLKYSYHSEFIKLASLPVAIMLMDPFESNLMVGRELPSAF